jgi:hypothetical protein
VTVEGAVKCLHSSAWAMFQAVDPPTAEPTDPANKTNLDTLVEQYSLDYYGWLLHQYDHAWPGIQHWDPTGYCDHVLFELGTEYLENLQAIADLDDQQLQTNDILIQEQLARRYMTRVQSLPGNFGVTSLLCQYEHAIPGVADGLVVMTPESGIAARSGTALSKAACAVWTEVQGSMTLTAVPCNDSGAPWRVNVYNVFCEPVTGSLFVPTSLLKSGTRYVVNWFDCESESSIPSESSDSSSDSSDSDSSSESSDSPSDSSDSPSESSDSPSDSSDSLDSISDSDLSSDDSSSNPSDSELSDSDASTDSSDSQLSDSDQSAESSDSDECGGECMWTWSESTQSWGGVYNYCLPPDETCVCTYPTVNGEYDGQTIYTPCGATL